jgi:hypothetical protein
MNIPVHDAATQQGPSWQKVKAVQAFIPYAAFRKKVADTPSPFPRIASSAHAFTPCEAEAKNIPGRRSHAMEFRSRASRIIAP